MSNRVQVDLDDLPAGASHTAHGEALTSQQGANCRLPVFTNSRRCLVSVTRATGRRQSVRGGCQGFVHGAQPPAGSPPGEDGQLGARLVRNDRNLTTSPEGGRRLRQLPPPTPPDDTGRAALRRRWCMLVQFRRAPDRDHHQREPRQQPAVPAPGTVQVCTGDKPRDRCHRGPQRAPASRLENWEERTQHGAVRAAGELDIYPGLERDLPPRPALGTQYPSYALDSRLAVVWNQPWVDKSRVSRSSPTTPAADARPRSSWVWDDSRSCPRARSFMRDLKRSC